MKIKLSLFAFCFSILAFLSFNKLHPYHVGSVEFNYNSKSKTFEVTAKFFEDDLETALNKKFNSSLFFGRTSDETAINQKLERYSLDNIQLKTDKKALKLNYIGYEINHESVNIYLESEPVKNPKSVETTVSMLYNQFKEQMNIIHIIVSGKRQSQKLNYPSQSVKKQF